jgi:nitrogen fixation protein FixH
MSAALTNKPQRPLTGRAVLICLVAFFGTVFAMNAVLVRAAVSSFGGVETESSYKAGLAFKNEVAVAKAQEARHWRVDAALRREAEGTIVVLTTRDADGRELTGLAAKARLSHPTDRRRDVPLTLVEVAPGRFEGSAQASHGQWDLVFDLARDGDVQFRSKSRIAF